jgi:hypothetical protein
MGSGGVLDASRINLVFPFQSSCFMGACGVLYILVSRVDSLRSQSVEAPVSHHHQKATQLLCVYLVVMSKIITAFHISKTRYGCPLSSHPSIEFVEKGSVGSLGEVGYYCATVREWCPHLEKQSLVLVTPFGLLCTLNPLRSTR